MEQMDDTLSISSALPDTQNLTDHRRLPIRKVGVRSIEVPIKLHLQSGFQSNSIANLGLAVSLDAAQKGTHMSRFIEAIESMGGEWNPMNLRTVLEKLGERLQADQYFIDFECPVFMIKKAPVSGKPGPMKYLIRASGVLTGAEYRQEVSLKAWVTTLCPCSKAISNYSAHNQRGEITLTFDVPDGPGGVDLRRLISDMETAASSPLFSLLKRVDEKAVTELAYDNPVFVEDLVRNVASVVRKNHKISRFTVEAENHESIHLHNAYAMLSSDDLD